MPIFSSSTDIRQPEIILAWNRTFDKTEDGGLPEYVSALWVLSNLQVELTDLSALKNISKIIIKATRLL